MRIEAYGQVQQLYKTQRVNRTASTSAVGAVKDQLQISNIGKDFQTAKAAVAAAPDIREDLTAADINASEIAEKLEKFNF